MDTPNAKNSRPGVRIPRDEARLRRGVMRCVVSMIYDESLKPSDRLAAVKTLMDHFLSGGNGGAAELRVVFEGLEDGFAD